MIIAVSFGVAAAFESPVMWLWFRNTLKRKVPAAEHRLRDKENPDVEDDQSGEEHHKSAPISRRIDASVDHPTSTCQPQGGVRGESGTDDVSMAEARQLFG